MSTYRTGNHWGVTIVREGDVVTQGRMEPDGPVQPHRRDGDQLVAVVVNGDQALAERIVDALNDARTPDVDHTRGAAEALAQVAERIANTADDFDAGTLATLRLILEATAAELSIEDLVQRVGEHTEECR